MNMFLFLLFSNLVLIINILPSITNKDNLIEKYSYKESGYMCSIVFSGEKVILNGEKPIEIHKAFPKNDGILQPVDKDSFVFLYRDKNTYSDIKCYYKDKNYVYGYNEYIEPLFTGFDYKSLKILIGYHFDDSINKLVKNPKDQFLSETCILGGCFIDKDNIYISGGLSSDENPFLGKWIRTKR